MVIQGWLRILPVCFIPGGDQFVKFVLGGVIAITFILQSLFCVIGIAVRFAVNRVPDTSKKRVIPVLASGRAAALGKIKTVARGFVLTVHLAVLQERQRVASSGVRNQRGTAWSAGRRTGRRAVWCRSEHFRVGMAGLVG